MSEGRKSEEKKAEPVKTADPVKNADLEKKADPAKTEKKKKRRARWIIRMKKTAVFLLVFFAVIGIITVDRSYAELMVRQGSITPYVQRLDKDMVEIGILGYNTKLNMTEFQEGYAQMEKTVTESLDRFAEGTRKLLGLDTTKNNLQEDALADKPDQGRTVHFPTQTL